MEENAVTKLTEMIKNNEMDRDSQNENRSTASREQELESEQHQQQLPDSLMQIAQGPRRRILGNHQQAIDDYNQRHEHLFQSSINEVNEFFSRHREE